MPRKTLWTGLILVPALILFVGWLLWTGSPGEPNSRNRSLLPLPEAEATESGKQADDQHASPAEQDDGEVPRSAATGLSGLVMDISRGPHGTGPVKGARVEIRFTGTPLTAAFQGDKLRALDHALALSSRDPGESVGAPSPSTPADFTNDTDSEGRFELSGLPPGVWISMRIVREGFLPHNQVRIVLAPGEAHYLGRIDLLRPGVVTGQVVDPHGRPVPQALVSLEAQPVARCGPDGSFAIHDVRSGVVNLSASHPGQISWSSGSIPVTVRSNELTRNVTLMLGGAVFVSGVVSDEGGTPLVGAEVAAAAGTEGDESTGAALTRSAQDGRFALYLPPGDFPALIKASLPGYSSASIALLQQETGSPLRLRLPHGPRILLKIEDAETGATVRPTGVFATSHFRSMFSPPVPFLVEDGLCRIALEGKPPLFLRLEAEEYVAALVGTSIVGRRDSSPKLVRLHRLQGLSGRIYDRNKHRIMGARIRSLLVNSSAIDKSQPYFLEGPSARSDASGRFEMSIDHACAGLLIVEADGYDREVKEFLLGTTPSHRQTTYVSVRLFVAARLEGVVTGFDGQPSAGLPVAAFRATSDASTFPTATDRYHTTRTDAHGRYRFDHLMPAVHTVLVGPDVFPEELGHEQFIDGWLRSKPRHLFSRRPKDLGIEQALRRSLFLEEISVPPGEPVRLDIDLRLRFGSIRGIVYLDGEPLEGARLRLTRGKEGFELPHDRTAPGGTFRFASLPPGEYALEVVRDGLPIGEQVTVPLGVNQHRNIVLQCNTGGISGRVLDESPASIILSIDRLVEGRPHPIRRTIAVDESGWFATRNLPLGRYRISGRGPNAVIPDHGFIVDGSEGGQPLLLQTQPAAQVTLAPDPEADIESQYQVFLEGADGREYRPRVIRLEDRSLLMGALPLGPATLRLVRSIPLNPLRPRTWHRSEPRLFRLKVEIVSGAKNVYSLSDALEVEPER